MVFEKSLTAMVKGIRANRGKEQEYISTCFSEIKVEIMSKTPSVKSNAIAKLAYLSMLGYDMSWANFAIVDTDAAPPPKSQTPTQTAGETALEQKKKNLLEFLQKRLPLVILLSLAIVILKITLYEIIVLLQLT